MSMIINSAAQRYLTQFAGLASLVLIIAVWLRSDISIVYPTLMGAIGVCSVYYYAMPHRRYVLPILWALFFVLGYILAFASVLIDPDSAGIGPLKDTSFFTFSDSSFFTVFLVMLSGMTGIATAVKLFEKVYGRHSRLALGGVVVDEGFRRRVKRISRAWLLISLVVIALMWALGIGRSGLSHATTLPFMLTGILVYVKNMIIPFFGYLVFIAAVRTHSYGQIRIVLFMLLVVGFVGSVAFVSRSFFIFVIIPAVLQIGFYESDRTLSRRFLRESGLLIFGMILILLPGIELIREVVYTGGTMSSLKAADITEGSSFLGALGSIISLSTSRIVGFRELVVITNYTGFDLLAPWQVFAGDETFNQMLSFALFRFEQEASGDNAFGYALGLWGMFYLSGSYFIVYLGSALAAGIVLAFEELFLQRGYVQFQSFMGLTIGLWIWGGIDWFLLSRLLVSASFCYVIVRYTKLSKFFQ